MTTLNDLINETSQSEVFGSIFDQATEDDLAFYFATYEVYGENFTHFLQRKEKLLKPQYVKYLSIEAETLNPLITEYLKITHDNEINNEHENDTKHTGYDDIVFGHKTTQGGSDGLTHGLTNTRTGSESHNTDLSITKSGAESHNTTLAITKTGSETHDTDFTSTRTGSENTSDTTYTEFQGSENTHTSGDSAALAASTPPTSPTSLSDFRNDGFASGVGTESMSDSQTDSTTSFTNRKDQKGGNVNKTYNSVKDTQDGGDTITYNNVKDTHSGGDTLTYNNVKDVHSGGDTVTYNNVKDTQGGTDTHTYGKTDTESGTNTNNFNSNVNDKGKDKRTEDLQEEREGYHGVPAELLGSARNYIINTNAFKWLVTELLTCFMDIMEY